MLSYLSKGAGVSSCSCQSVSQKSSCRIVSAGSRPCGWEQRRASCQAWSARSRSASWNSLEKRASVAAIKRSSCGCLSCIRGYWLRLPV